MAKMDKKLGRFESARQFDASTNGRSRVSYQIIVWSAVVWVAICVAPYVYALNDLTTWP
jgi:hypothetical protein